MRTPESDLYEIMQLEKQQISVEISEEEINQHAKKQKISTIAELPFIEPLTFSDIKNMEVVPEEYILSPILPTQGIGFVYAAAGVGKTMFMLNMAYCIASGGKFLKYLSPKPRTVLYVDGEMKSQTIKSRLMQISNQQGQISNPSNLLIYTPDKFKIPNKDKTEKLPKISTSQGQAWYTEAINKKNVEVIIFDNLSMLSNIDENKSDEWFQVQDWLLSLKSNGKTIIVVHHAGKDKSGYRGTSRMLDAVDTAISLQEVKSDNLEDDYTLDKKFKIDYQKNRGFSGKDALSYEVTFNPCGWSYQSMEKTMLEMVAERISINMTHKDIAAEFKVSRPYISKLVKKAKNEGLLK